MKAVMMLFVPGMVGLMLMCDATVPSARAPLPTATQAQLATPTPSSEFDFGTLRGRWVRPDGGYMITINRVNPDGKLDANYANPKGLPFSRAEAVHDGDTTKVFLELTAGGYNGSTYTLSYDPAGDDHDPKPLYYQLEAEYPKQFDWTYVESGPTVWRVEIAKLAKAA